eukprot:CAMPEP_0119554304 /NCGR_PEP_ID=MMETSP1352-20130426/6833_1 /TAXON_ID=265584 /ORGANISM="Stauroneis constricta, Strain CCMP1120" /LENGTH=49 /DNA_ID= /DNA_START= /DNA_END= /DNA_ORIENTATION=
MTTTLSAADLLRMSVTRIGRTTATASILSKRRDGSSGGLHPSPSRLVHL